uniref:uncharacterized protein LOC122601496 n=1 Tax=Erigeron canadensis TaxID=72917 RepID=UPI001CB8C805|nr:uncharacterized protein LOC122601496 [Erigeron canadensis]
MASFDTNKPTRCDERGGSFAAEGISEFSTDKVFKSHQDLTDWVQNMGRSLGYVIVIKRTNARPCGYVYKIRLMCDRSGVYKNKSLVANPTSKKTNCPFELEGNYSCKYDCWKLRVICEKHNHEPALNMKGHPYAMRLSKDEARLVLDLSKKNMKPQAILAILKKQNANNMSTMSTIYNALTKFRKSGLLEKSKGQPTTGEEIASMSSHTVDGNKSKRAVNRSYQFGLSNTCKNKTFMEQPINGVKSYVNPMCPAHTFDANKSKRSIDHSDQFADPDTFETNTETFTEKAINHEDSASPNQMYPGYVFDANKSTRTIDYIDPFSVHNSCETSREVFMGQPIKREEDASQSPVYAAYTFDADKSKRPIDHMDPFVIENWVQELDSAKFGAVKQDIEDHMPREQMIPSFRRVPSPQIDLMETFPVRNISIANVVRDVFMCTDGKGHDTSAPDANLIAFPDNEPTFARPFQPYRDMVLSKPDRQFLMKQFLEEDNAHGQSSRGNSGEVDDGAEEYRTNTAVEPIDEEDKDMNVDSDVEVEKKYDKGVQFDSKLVASSHPKKSTRGDENERNLEVEGTSGFSTNMMFKSCQDLIDWVQNVGHSLGYFIVTKRSNAQPSGDVYKVSLMCDRGGIFKSKSSIRKNTRSKKTNCPFELEGKKSRRHGSWTLRVMCEDHNHEPALHMENHPFAKRLSEDEIRLVLDLSKKNVSPLEILSTLKAQNKNNFSTLSTIYNLRQKFRRTNNAEISMGLPIDSEGSASATREYTAYTFDANKSESTIGHTDPSRKLDTSYMCFKYD